MLSDDVQDQSLMPRAIIPPGTPKFGMKAVCSPSSRLRLDQPDESAYERAMQFNGSETPARQRDSSDPFFPVLGSFVSDVKQYQNPCENDYTLFHSSATCELAQLKFYIS